MDTPLVVSLISLGLVLLNSLYANFSNSPRAEKDSLNKKIDDLKNELSKRIEKSEDELKLLNRTVDRDHLTGEQVKELMRSEIRPLVEAVDNIKVNIDRLHSLVLRNDRHVPHAI